MVEECVITITVYVDGLMSGRTVEGDLCRVLAEAYPDGLAEALKRLIEQHAEQLDRLGRWVRKILLEVLEEKGGGSGG